MCSYPVRSRSSVIDCPVHGFTVALNEAGRIASTCPACVAEARTARRRLPSIRRRRLERPRRILGLV
jgi:hypothetical protein